MNWVSVFLIVGLIVQITHTWNVLVSRYDFFREIFIQNMLQLHNMVVIEGGRSISQLYKLDKRLVFQTEVMQATVKCMAFDLILIVYLFVPHS